MPYLKGVIPHVASLVSYQVLVPHCTRKMMAMREVLCPMEKAYLTDDPTIVDVLEGASVRWLWARRCLRSFAVYFKQARG